jgi:hypothetical protein
MKVYIPSKLWYMTREQALIAGTDVIIKRLRALGHNTKPANYHEEDESALIECNDCDLYIVVDLDASGAYLNVAGFPIKQQAQQDANYILKKLGK